MNTAWPRVPLKRLLGVQTGSWGDDPDGDHDIPCIRVADFDRPHLMVDDPPTIRSIPPQDQLRLQVRHGDLLIEKSGGTSINPVGCVVRYEGTSPAVCSNFIARLRPRPGNSTRFWKYSLGAAYLDGRTWPYVRQTTGIQNLDLAGWLGLVVDVPPLADQVAIADFLDRETAKIDALIDKQRALATALHRRRQAAIDSAIPWDGDRAQLRRDLEFLTSGSRGWGDFYADEGDIFLRIGDLSRESYRLRTDDLQHVQIPAGAEGSRSRTKVGDLLFSITAYLGSVGVVSSYLAGSYVSQHVALARIRQRVWLPEFVAWCVLSGFGQVQLNEQAYGGTKMQLSLGDVRGIEVPVIPISEQRAVIERLDHFTTEIDGLIRRTAQLVQLAQERRAALITAAVTGQLDVSGEAA